MLWTSESGMGWGWWDWKDQTYKNVLEELLLCLHVSFSTPTLCVEPPVNVWSTWQIRKAWQRDISSSLSLDEQQGHNSSTFALFPIYSPATDSSSFENPSWLNTQRQLWQHGSLQNCTDEEYHLAAISWELMFILQTSDCFLHSSPKLTV